LASAAACSAARVAVLCVHRKGSPQIVERSVFVAEPKSRERTLLETVGVVRFALDVRLEIVERIPIELQPVVGEATEVVAQV
jgi:hypothetical protein